MPKVNLGSNQKYSSSECSNGDIICNVGTCISDSAGKSAEVGTYIGAFPGLLGGIWALKEGLMSAATGCAPAYCGCAFGFCAIVSALGVGAVVGAGAGRITGGVVGGTIGVMADAGHCVKNTLCHTYPVSNHTNNSLEMNLLDRNNLTPDANPLPVMK